jgi:hypothetical protein
LKRRPKKVALAGEIKEPAIKPVERAPIAALGTRQAINDVDVTAREFDALGFTFEPLGVVRLALWHCRQAAGGPVEYSNVVSIDPPLTGETMLDPETHEIVAEGGVSALWLVSEKIAEAVKILEALPIEGGAIRRQA